MGDRVDAIINQIISVEGPLPLLRYLAVSILGLALITHAVA